MYQEIKYEVSEPLGLITLNRPDRLNAWTNRMANEVRRAIGEAEKDPAVVAIVITGEGRGFCAGADMETLNAIGSGKGGDRERRPLPISGRRMSHCPGTARP